MYFTIFHKGTEYEHKIIHKQPKQQYNQEPPLYRFPECFTVNEKPSLEQAQIIFKICKSNDLCGGEGITEEIFKI